MSHSITMKAKQRKTKSIFRNTLLTCCLKRGAGFTLMELLVTITIIGLLATVAIISVNPGERFSEARDSERLADVSSILGAIKVFQVENSGDLPGNLDSLAKDATYEIGTGGGACALSGCTVFLGGESEPLSNSECGDIEELVTRGNIPEIPFDPITGDVTATDYFVTLKSNGIIAVGACSPDLESEIKVAR